MAAMLSVAALLLAGIYIYYQSKAQELGLDNDAVREYGRHYLFVSSDSSQMMQDMFDDISAACENSGAYLEWCGKGTQRRYTASECIDISIAMEADGIILYPDGSGTLEASIDRALDRGIPVVTILRDLPDSSRVSYVGVSNYQMGELYGGWLLSLMKKGTNRVCLLQDSGDSENEIQLLFTQTVQAVRNGSSDDEKMELVTRSVDSTVDFDAEEVIRDIPNAVSSDDHIAALPRTIREFFRLQILLAGQLKGFPECFLKPVCLLVVTGSLCSESLNLLHEDVFLSLELCGIGFNVLDDHPVSIGLLFKVLTDHLQSIGQRLVIICVLFFQPLLQAQKLVG